MKKQLLDHIRRMERELAAIESSPCENRRPGHLRALLAYHLAQTQAFQHERLIHLLVMLFFAMLLLAAAIGAIFLPTWQMLAVTIILTLTEICYLRHYYVLENNTQKLYPLTQRLHALQSGER
ncbi:type IV secretory pathway component VirB8 [Ereboglobus sp. PH5-10]|uniref:hypothetical protein n=1 Tax=Ereboglobus sp. PH5-10 TaxID=2940629 RepID=UPI0024074D79|nr:hypothetical protein [Ereboglobus sp. PH5-10]MDF9828400.1 type IV secretory pathway component VirB8 [Ereboglobus sp. PH5-10]